MREFFDDQAIHFINSQCEIACCAGGIIEAIVLLDVMMPRGNGYEVCEAIRRTDGETPVLFLTALDSDVDELKGMREGAYKLVYVAPERFRKAAAHEHGGFAIISASFEGNAIM